MAEKAGKAFGVYIVIFTLAWLFMLFVGILSAHSVVGGTLGYWDSFWCTFIGWCAVNLLMVGGRIE
jgi:hypothetical protein